jgi:hypothetical protein
MKQTPRAYELPAGPKLMAYLLTALLLNAVRHSR